MKITYANAKVERCFSNYSTMTKKIGPDLTRGVKKCVDVIEAMPTFEGLCASGLRHIERLSSNDKEQYSLHVSANVRLIIEPRMEDGSVCVCSMVEIEGVCDYHGDKCNWYIS